MYIGHSDEGQKLLSIEHLYHYQLYTKATRNVRAIPQARRRQQKTNEMEGKTDAQFTAYLSPTHKRESALGQRLTVSLAKPRQILVYILTK